MWKSLEGKKTYIGVAVVLLAVAAFAFGVVSEGQAVSGAAAGFAMIGLGLGHKADRYAKATIEATQLAKEILEERRKTGTVDLLKRGDAISQIARELEEEPAAGGKFAIAREELKYEPVDQPDGAGGEQ